MRHSSVGKEDDHTVGNGFDILNYRGRCGAISARTKDSELTALTTLPAMVEIVEHCELAPVVCRIVAVFDVPVQQTRRSQGWRFASSCERGRAQWM